MWITDSMSEDWEDILECFETDILFFLISTQNSEILESSLYTLPTN